MKPQGWHTLTPRLFVDDPERFVRFLVDAFGASGEFQVNVPSFLTIGDSQLMIGSTSARPATSSVFYLYVDDADAVYAQALAAGATSRQGPVNTPWGDRRAIVADPFGNDWQIATSRG